MFNKLIVFWVTAFLFVNFSEIYTVPIVNQSGILFKNNSKLKPINLEFMELTFPFQYIQQIDGVDYWEMPQGKTGTVTGEIEGTITRLNLTALISLLNNGDLREDIEVDLDILTLENQTLNVKVAGLANIPAQNIDKVFSDFDNGTLDSKNYYSVFGGSISTTSPEFDGLNTLYVLMREGEYFIDDSGQFSAKFTLYKVVNQVIDQTPKGSSGKGVPGSGRKKKK